MIVRILPIIVSFLLLGAHFLRAGNLPLMAGCLLIPLLLLVKTRWSVIVLQIFAYIGAVIWVDTTIAIYHQRIILGTPWERAVIILGGVALFTVFSGLLLNSQVVKEKYPSRTH